MRVKMQEKRRELVKYRSHCLKTPLNLPAAEVD